MAGEFHTVLSMLWNNKAAHSNFKIKLRTFRVAAYTMYSKGLAVDSENLCDQNLPFSLPVVI